MQADRFYDDGRLGITSTGPNPPTVGQETSYTVRLRVGSTLNDIGDVRITAIIPDGVRYTDKTYRTAGEVNYNERTQTVTWTMPLITAGTGRLKPAEEFDFQVAVVPGEHQRNHEIDLLKSLQLEATDEFTDTAVEKKLGGEGFADLPKTDIVQ